MSANKGRAVAERVVAVKTVKGDPAPGKVKSRSSDPIKARTKMVHARVEESVKNQAAKTLKSMGLSMSDAVRVFLTKVAAEEKMPFQLKTPNATTRAAMKEAEQLKREHRARFGTAKDLFDDLEKTGRK